MNISLNLQDEDGAEARLEQWEMVVGASRLYDWHESRLRSAPPVALQRTLSSDSQAPDTLRSSEFPEPPMPMSASVHTPHEGRMFLAFESTSSEPTMLCLPQPA